MSQPNPNDQRYDYAAQRPYVFTDQGQRDLLQAHVRVQALLAATGAFTLEAFMRGFTASSCSSWDTIACLDRLVEIGIVECVRAGVVSQDHVYAAPLRARPDYA